MVQRCQASKPDNLTMSLPSDDGSNTRPLSGNAERSRVNTTEFDEPIVTILDKPGQHHRHRRKPFNLKPADVAAMFSVNPKTVARWSTVGILQSIRTPGGHRRYRESDVVGAAEQPLRTRPRLIRSALLFRRWPRRTGGAPPDIRALFNRSRPAKLADGYG